MSLPAAFGRYRSELESELRGIFDGRSSPLYGMLKYHLGWLDEKGKEISGFSGKGLRPTLCMVSCEALGGNPAVAAPVAAAIELVHNFSLIHDDIQDNDSERRHRPTVWSLFGKPQAINAGTTMHILANMAVRRLDKFGIPVERQDKIRGILDEASLSLIEGQYLDISFEERFDITVSEYLDMIERKTAALIECSVECGAILANADEESVAVMHDIGNNLGLAFQIRDDILGIWGDEKDTGKPGSDIYHRKKSLPIVNILVEGSSEQKNVLEKIYKADVMGEQEVNTILKILESIGAQDHAQEMVDRFSARAIEMLCRVPLEPAGRQDFREIAAFLAQRNF